MRKKIKKVLNVIFGIILIFFGIIGLFLPILQGWLFIFLGLVFLGYKPAINFYKKILKKFKIK